MYVSHNATHGLHVVLSVTTHDTQCHMRARDTALSAAHAAERNKVESTRLKNADCLASGVEMGLGVPPFAIFSRLA
jgi:hypothetical protein